jgi:PhnB protein
LPTEAIEGQAAEKQMHPYLSCNGQCEEAFKVYEKCLSGKITFSMAYQGPGVAKHVPAEWGKKILHTTLDVNGELLQGGDSPPGQDQKPQGIAVTLGIKDPAEAERIFRALAEKGEIRMPMQATFWAQKFGMLADRFGIPWMVNCSKAMS